MSYTLIGRSDVKAFAAGVVNTYATNIPVSAGDLLGFRSRTFGTGCRFAGGATLGAQDVVGFRPSAGDAVPGETQNMTPQIGFRLNVSATLDPSAPSSITVNSSATKGKQSADKLKVKVTVDQDGTLDLGGKGKVAQRKPALAAAKQKKYRLKKKTGIALQAGVEKVIRLKFKQNRKSVKRIEKRLRRSKKARKRSKVTVNLTATTAAGIASDSKLKIKLKP